MSMSLFSRCAAKVAAAGFAPESLPMGGARSSRSAMKVAAACLAQGSSPRLLGTLFSQCAAKVAAACFA